MATDNGQAVISTGEDQVGLNRRGFLRSTVGALVGVPIAAAVGVAPCVPAAQSVLAWAELPNDLEMVRARYDIAENWVPLKWNAESGEYERDLWLTSGSHAS